MTIKVYFSPSCAPCQEVVAKLRDRSDVETVDVDTDEGFLEFSDVLLVHSESDGSIPSAFKDNQECEILVDDKAVYFNCPGDPSSFEPE